MEIENIETIKLKDNLRIVLKDDVKWMYHNGGNILALTFPFINLRNILDHKEGNYLNEDQPFFYNDIFIEFTTTDQYIEYEAVYFSYGIIAENIMQHHGEFTEFVRKLLVQQSVKKVIDDVIRFVEPDKEHIDYIHAIDFKKLLEKNPIPIRPSEKLKKEINNKRIRDIMMGEIKN